MLQQRSMSSYHPMKLRVRPRNGIKHYEDKVQQPQSVSSKPKGTVGIKTEKTAYVKSPQSGAWILQGGPAYGKLTDAQKVEADKTLQMRARPRRGLAATTPSRTALKAKPITKAHVERILAKKTATIEDLEDTLARTTQPALRRQLQEQIKRRGDRRGASTRGWAARAPRQGRQRQHLHEQCGDSAFLLPEAQKFPLMAKCGHGLGECECKIDCGGVQAAYQRARQHKYEHVAQSARRILRERCPESKQSKAERK